MIRSYLRWLQKDNPVGEVERYPALDADGQTSLRGVYVAGDLTGIPLLRLSAESGARLVRKFVRDPEFSKHSEPIGKPRRAGRQEGARDPGPREGPNGRRASGGEHGEPGGVLDVAIVGAGPAGVSAALECRKQGLRYEILEAVRPFNTIENFPKGKIILAKPDAMRQEAPLTIENGVKETLLEDLHGQIRGQDLRITPECTVRGMGFENGALKLETDRGGLRSRRVILSIGKTGNARRLKVSGADLPKVFNKLYDPGEFRDCDILVVGGGDTALETSVALARAGNRVTHSYRKSGFSRPKPENQQAFDEEVAKGTITPVFDSEVDSISENKAVLKTKDGERAIPNSAVFAMIGRELPLSFFRRCGIRMEGEKDFSYWIFLAAMVSFFSMLYFGKAGYARDLFPQTEGWAGRLAGYLAGPVKADGGWGLEGYAWYGSLNYLLGWSASLVWLASGTLALGLLINRRRRYFSTAWNRIKYGYFIGVGAIFTAVYFGFVLGRDAGWAEEPTYWYSLLYTVTIALFGFRRAQVRRTRYIRYQMATLVFIQVFFLFLLPFYLYEPLIGGRLGADHWLVSEMFPQGKWSSFGFILFWPLNINNFGTSTFWTWFPVLQTFVILPAIILRWGKGAYCGWICSCGGMAESLGDEYRHLAPHGPRAKKLENIGQFVLLGAFVATGLFYLSKHQILTGAGSVWLADSLWGLYKLSIDVFFAGVLGLGVYFFLGGRIWCRYGCPLAALMHVYTRFSGYRIFSEKKKCISCNICTKVCHMGIDVMNFANKGIPMNDVECVRCSACVQSCPTQVLAFGSLGHTDLDNTSRRELPEYSKDDWRAGLGT